MEWRLVLANSLYFLALINPASKIFLLSAKTPPYSWGELRVITWRATAAAFMILVLFSAAGTILLTTIFHVELYSLSVAGGVILFSVGLTAVRKGVFYDENTRGLQGDISIVPMAAPLIAGPGTITAAIPFASANGLPITIVCLSLALVMNMAAMLFSLQIGGLLERYRATGPLIRITGLIVAAVSVQMIFGGVEAWVRQLALKL